MSTEWERANYVCTIVAAALEPGGPLHNELSDLVTRAVAVALDAAGIPDTDDGAAWPMDPAAVLDDIAQVVREATFQATLEYVRPLDKPQLSVVS